MPPHRSAAGHPYDSISRADLEAKGGLKWTAYPGAIGAWIAEMDFGVAPQIRATYTAINDSDLFGYPPARLIDDMRQATAEFYADQYGWEFEPSAVQPLPDVLTGLSATIDIFTPPGAKVIVPTPAYMPFLDVPLIAGREIVELPLHLHTPTATWEFDFDALDRVLATAGPDGQSGGLLVLCNPHNPIGKVYSRTELERIAQLVDKHGATVFNDEIHAPLVYPGLRHVNYPTVSPAAARHTVTATSHSKSFNTPGLKCAQIIFSNPEHRQEWSPLGEFLSKGASNPGLACAATAYRDARAWLETTRAYLHTNTQVLGELLAAHLPEVGYVPPQGTYLAFLNMNALDLPGNPQSFFLERAQVALTDGSLCGAAGHGCVRMNLGTPTHIVEDMVLRMAAAVRSYQQEAQKA